MFILAVSLLLSLSRALQVVKYGTAPVLGPSFIAGSQDYCGARDMGIAQAGEMLTLVYSGYSTCSANQEQCGADGCCQLMFASLPAPPADGSRGANATRLGSVLPAPGAGFFNLTTDAGLLFDSGLWHMWVTEMPLGFAGAHRNIGHLIVAGSADAVPTTGWIYESTRVFPALPAAWAPFAVDEPRVYPATGGGWIMYLGSQGNNNCDGPSPAACNAWCLGYATSASLNGPWLPSDGCIIGSGNSSGYQAEAFVAFKAAGVYYVITNSLGTQGFDGPDWLHDIAGDLWSAPAQTGPFSLAVKGFVPRGPSGAWDAGYAYVTAIAGLGGYELKAGQKLYGAYMGGPGILPSAGPISIGLFSLSL